MRGGAGGREGGNRVGGLQGAARGRIPAFSQKSNEV